MPLDFPASLAVFLGTVPGLAWPLAQRLPLTATERLVASTALSLVGVYLLGWIVYLGALPPALLWGAPAMGIAGLGFGWRPFVAALREPDTRTLINGQALVTAWCLGWLATVQSYSGGGWAADWFEHWERARFFLEHGPLDTKFLGQYALTARPPLANIVTGAFLYLTRVDFPHYQFFSTLLATLAFLPAALLARRWGPPRAVGILAVAVMVSPLFVQNATFAWTKLPTAFFVLTALHLILRANDGVSSGAATVLAGVCLAAGILTHYSAGPYFIMLAIGWIVLGWPHRADPAWRRQTALAAAAGALVLATWFTWSLTMFGTHGTFLTNSSVTSADARQGNQLVKMALNLFDTLVPHFLRTLDRSLIAQTSAWGAFRDGFFQSYQVNLPLAFGSVAGIALAFELVRSAKDADRRVRTFWILLVAGVVLLGTASHGQRDHWGLAHICLQALVILGLTWLAARWDSLARPWQLALVVGAVFDFSFGIALHFGGQSFALERWLAPGRTFEATFATLSEPTRMNLLAKFTHRVPFVAEAVALPLGVILVILPLILALAVYQVCAPAGAKSVDRPS